MHTHLLYTTLSLLFPSTARLPRLPPLLLPACTTLLTPFVVSQLRPQKANLTGCLKCLLSLVKLCPCCCCCVLDKAPNAPAVTGPKSIHSAADKSEGTEEVRAERKAKKKAKKQALIDKYGEKEYLKIVRLLVALALAY